MDALLGLLHPGWRFVIGVCVAVAVVAAGYRLLRRGPTRMTRAMVVAAMIIAGLVALTVVFG